MTVSAVFDRFPESLARVVYSTLHSQNSPGASRRAHRLLRPQTPIYHDPCCKDFTKRAPNFLKPPNSQAYRFSGRSPHFRPRLILVGSVLSAPNWLLLCIGVQTRSPCQALLEGRFSLESVCFHTTAVTAGAPNHINIRNLEAYLGTEIWS